MTCGERSPQARIVRNHLEQQDKHGVDQLLPLALSGEWSGPTARSASSN
jgi:hypothetical protein